MGSNLWIVTYCKLDELLRHWCSGLKIHLCYWICTYKAREAGVYDLIDLNEGLPVNTLWKALLDLHFVSTLLYYVHVSSILETHFPS